MRTVEELEALLEVATRERDEARERADRFVETVRRREQEHLDACAEADEYRAERDEARAIVGSCWLTYSEGERDKARAWAHKCERERDEARAEVDRLKRERDAAYMAAGEYSQDEVNAMTTEMIALRKEYEKSAYRRGAEAMREACANAFAEYEGAGLSAQILAMELPIPEEP